MAMANRIKPGNGNGKERLLPAPPKRGKPQSSNKQPGQLTTPTRTADMQTMMTITASMNEQDTAQSAQKRRDVIKRLSHGTWGETLKRWQVMTGGLGGVLILG